MKENGRSMVEMLGVLAIIGVLSIAGIAGYRTAMDMHAANRIIDDVNKRAVMTAGFIATNGAKDQNESYETDLGNTNALGKTVEVISNGDGTFNVWVNGITTGACKQIANKDWDVPMYIGTTEVTSPNGCTGNDIQMAFEFADDLGDSTTTAGSGTVITPTFDPSTYQGCESGTDCEDNICWYGRCISEEEYCYYASFSENSGGCDENEYCLFVQCVSGGCETDTDCSSDTSSPYCQKFQTENSDSAQIYSMCVECTENTHCGDGYYCGGAGGSCYQSSVNRCMRADIAAIYTASNGKTYYLSKNDMPWWDAENFCAALGKSLVPAHILNTKGVDGSESYDTVGNKTDLVEELYVGFGTDGSVWTSSDFGVSSSSSFKTCYAYIVYLSNGNLGSHDRNDNYGHGFHRALCW